MKKVLALLLLLIVACGGSSEETVVEDTTTTTIQDTSTTTIQDTTTTTIPPAPTSDINYIELYNSKLGTELCSDAKEIDTTSEECLRQYKENLNYLITLQNEISDFGSALIAYYETYPELVNQEYEEYINFVENEYSQIFTTVSNIENKYIERFGGVPKVLSLNFSDGLEVNCPAEGEFGVSENLKNAELVFTNNSNEEIFIKITDSNKLFKNNMVNSGGNFFLKSLKATNYLDEEYELNSNLSFFVNHMFHRVSEITLPTQKLNYGDEFYIEIFIENTSEIYSVSLEFYNIYMKQGMSPVDTNVIQRVSESTVKAIFKLKLVREEGNRKTFYNGQEPAEVFLFDGIGSHNISYIWMNSNDSFTTGFADSFNFANGISWPLPTKCGPVGQEKLKNLDYQELVVLTSY